MLVGIVSDTHDDGEFTAAAVDRFESAGVDTVVHCGDIVAPFTATAFDADFDFYAVRGNNDGEWALADTVADFGTYLGEMGELTLDGQAVAVYHGTSPAIVDALVESGTYDYVLHGHTHQQTHEVHEETVSVNPGGIAFEQAPDPPEIALLDTEAGEVTFERP